MKALATLTTQLNIFIRDKDGKIVIGQAPNVPIVLWFVCMLVARIVPDTSLRNGFEFLSVAFLFTWAYLEITEGSSYFRRVLGAVVLVGIILSKVL